VLTALGVLCMLPVLQRLGDAYGFYLNLVAFWITDPDTDPYQIRDSDLYHCTGKTCLGGGMHCSSASN